MTLDIWLTLMAHINQVRREAAQRLGVLGPLLNKRSVKSITNGVLLYKKLIILQWTMPAATPVL
jgi:hypothetical protein